MAHVVIIGALPASLINFRGELIAALVAAGHRVTALAGPAAADTRAEIESLGVTFVEYPVARNGFNPIEDLKTWWALRKVLRALKPDVVLAYTIKPVIWGGLAARSAPGLRFFALITGLGYAFQGEGWLRGSLKRVAVFLYRAGVSRAERVVFQNPDNQAEFVNRGIVERTRTDVVNGSGVDVLRFSPTPLPQGNIVFLTIARLLGEKGLREYVRAAGQIKRVTPNAVFRIVGPADPSPDGIPAEEVTRWTQDGVVEYLGAADDVRPHIQDCHVYVLASYHEGMPRTVLEAMAMGRPILTTEVSGCRETVVPGDNGYLVPAGDAEALAERMRWFIEHVGELQAMGEASRRLAEARFDVRAVNARLLRIMELA